MNTKSRSVVRALVAATILSAGVCSVFPAAKLKAIEAAPSGLQMREIHAMARPDMPVYSDKYQHYGLLESVRP